MNIKDIATTLALLGSGTLVMTGCGKDPPATEVPGGEEAAPPADDAAEAKCGEGHEGEGHCGDEAAGEGDGEGSCGGDGEAAGEGDGEGSCGGK